MRVFFENLLFFSLLGFPIAVGIGLAFAGFPWFVALLVAIVLMAFVLHGFATDD